MNAEVCRAEGSYCLQLKVLDGSKKKCVMCVKETERKKRGRKMWGSVN